MTDWTDFIAVDWGTTNRRAYRVDAPGTVTAEFEDDRGVTAISPGTFGDGVGDIRAQLGDGPLLLAGMVGSNRGWAEVGYVPAPATIGDLAAALHWMAGDVAIVPGVAVRDDRCDVMRGEEVQALGAVAGGLVAAGARICHPGTHAKWIDMAGGTLTGFRTAMTGELFALLRDHSILSSQLAGAVTADDAFLAGVDVVRGGEPLLDALFGVRARGVLARLDPAHAAAYASGIVIGSDVVAHAQAGEHIELIGSPDLCALYAAALDRIGGTSGSTDGAQAFVAGMVAIRDKFA